MKLLLFSVLIILSSCELAGIADDFVFNNPPDPIDTLINPIDTIIPAPLVDSCDQLINYTDTAFTMLSAQFFNGLPFITQWNKYGTDFYFTDLVSLMQFYYPQYSYTYYENNDAVALFIDGIDNPAMFNGPIGQPSIWTRDAVGQIAYLAATSRAFFHFGAMTYEESLVEAKHRFNVRVFHYTNTGWTPLQNDNFGREVMHFKDCKKGEVRADFKYATGISQTVVDSAKTVFHWQQVWQ